jgi:hypothetical protein
VEYEPGAAIWPCARGSHHAAAPPRYRSYQPAALAGARSWYYSTADTAACSQDGAAGWVAAVEGTAPSAAAATATQQPAADTGPDLIELDVPEELVGADSGAAAAATHHSSGTRRHESAAAPMSVPATSGEPPELYVCPITQVRYVAQQQSSQPRLGPCVYTLTAAAIRLCTVPTCIAFLTLP